MRRALVFLIAALGAAGHAQAPPDLARVGAVAGRMRELRTNSTEQDRLQKLYDAVRAASELLSDPGLCTEDLGVCAPPAEVSAAVKAIFARELGADTLKWWVDNVDVVIARWSHTQDGLAKGLKSLNFALPPGTERPKWKVYLTNTALVVFGLPLMVLAEFGRGPLDMSTSPLQSLVFDLTNGSDDNVDLRRAINVLGFRKLIREAYAETCPGSLDGETP